jgi:hypothetical protein
MNLSGKNVALLSTCQALLFPNNTTVIALNGLAGHAFAAGLAALAWLRLTRRGAAAMAS